MSSVHKEWRIDMISIPNHLSAIFVGSSAFKCFTRLLQSLGSNWGTDCRTGVSQSLRLSKIFLLVSAIKARRRSPASMSPWMNRTQVRVSDGARSSMQHVLLKGTGGTRKRLMLHLSGLLHSQESLIFPAGPCIQLRWKMMHQQLWGFHSSANPRYVVWISSSMQTSISTGLCQSDQRIDFNDSWRCLRSSSFPGSALRHLDLLRYQREFDSRWWREQVTFHSVSGRFKGPVEPNVVAWDVVTPTWFN